MSISGLSGSNAMMQFYNIKEEADLKSYVNKLLRDFDSAGTKEAKDKIAAQLKSLASSSGASLSDLGASRASDTSIFSPKLAVAPAATPTANHSSNSEVLFDGPANTAGASLSANEAKSLADQYKSIDNHQAWTRASANEDQAMMREIHAEFGIADGNKATNDVNKDKWAVFAAQSDKVTVYDAATGEIKDGKKIQENDIVEFNSSKFGKVLMQVGGDGNLDGGDDVIISKSNEAAVANTSTGLNKVNEGLAEAKALAGPAGLSSILDQLENPYQLSDTNIKNLIAAILQAINK